MVEISFKWLRRCTEIPVVLLFFSFMVCDPVNTNFIIYRTCYVSLGHNQSDCAKLGSKNRDNATRDLEKVVEPYANIIMMTQALITLIVPALLCLFIGPWSDKRGRKPVLIFNLIGYTIASIAQIIVTLIPSLSPWYLLSTSITSILFGGFAPLLMTILCYITDITTEEERGLRIGLFEAVLVFGMLLGSLSSSYIFALGGYVAVFGVGTVCYALALLYIVFVVSESVTDTRQNQDNTPIFAFKHVADMVKTTFSPRESYVRCVLLMTIGIATVYILAANSDTFVFFLFVRKKFEWSLKQYTLYKSVRHVLLIVAIYLGLSVLHKLLKVAETPLLLVGFVSYFVSVLIQDFATEGWQLYLAGGVRCISGVISPMCRSLISKLVPKDESGKVFSITVALESLTAMIGIPLYTFFYNYTIDTDPGAFNFLTAGFLALEIVLVTIVIIVQRTLLNVHSYHALSVNVEGEGE